VALTVFSNHVFCRAKEAGGDEEGDEGKAAAGEKKYGGEKLKSTIKTACRKPGAINWLCWHERRAAQLASGLAAWHGASGSAVSQ